MADTEYKAEAWRMTRYYPESYAKFMAALGVGIDYDDGDFDRYEAEFRADLMAYAREVAEKAWDEAVEETHALGWLYDFAKSDALARNPHRADRIEKGEVGE